MAKTPNKTDDTPVVVEAAVLRDCDYGPVGAVVSLSEADAETGAAAGSLDLHESAVAYAKTQQV